MPVCLFTCTAQVCIGFHGRGVVFEQAANVGKAIFYSTRITKKTEGAGWLKKHIQIL